MADECDQSQQSIKFYLEAFLPYICECVRATDLLVHLPYFNKAERKEIFPLSTTRPVQATNLAIETLLRKNDPGIYVAFKEAMGPDQANIPKVFDILSGRNFPTQEEGQYTAVIQLFMEELIGRINPFNILPHLKREGVLDNSIEEEIKCEERNYGQRRASWLLLYHLPQRVEGWFKIFMKTLIEDNHAGLAQKLDPDMYEKISAQLRADSEQRLAVEPSQEQEHVLEVFEDAVEDIKLLNAMEDQNEQDTDIDSKVSSLETDELKETEELSTNMPMSTNTSEIHLKVIYDGEPLHATSPGCSPERNAGDLPSQLAASVTQNSKNEKNDSIKDNLEKFMKPRLLDKEIDHGTENIEPISDEASTNVARARLPVFGTLTTTVGEFSLPTTSKVSDLRPAASFGYSVDKIVLDRKVVDGSPRKKTPTSAKVPVVIDSGDNVESQSESLTEAKATASRTRHVEPLSYDQSLDLSGFLLSDSRQRKKETNNERSSETTGIELQDLLATLPDCLQTKENDEENPTVLYSRDSDSSLDDTENDLNAKSLEPSVATDFDNIENPIEQEIPLREYQKELARDGCDGENCIIIAPTNSGKTWVACRIIQEHFRKSKGRQIAKCAFVVENTALARQQGECCAELLSHLRTKVISGETQRDRKEYLKDFVDRRDILVVTAKVLHNTLKQKEIDSIQKFSLIVFDECHHTQSDHPYNEIMHLYLDAKLNGVPVESLPQIVGLTASLGVGGGTTIEKTVKHMKTVMANLNASSLCRVRKHQRELEKYMTNPDEEIIIVPRRVNDSFREEVSQVMRAIEGLIKQTIGRMIPVDVEIINKLVKSIPADKGSQAYINWLSDLRKAQVELRSEEMRRVLNACRLHLKDYNQAILLYTDARVEDALDILEKFMEQRKSSGNNQMEEHMLKIFETLIKMDFSACSSNPKLAKIKEILLDVLGGHENARGIIFVKTRQLAGYMIKWMKETDGLKDLNPTEFVGQTASVQVGGMTKHEQKDVLEYFKDGLHKLIVATSVAEEGLDITKCNLVIRYEHVTNEIVRTQSRGRARAPGSRYYVITGQGSPIADKEEKNAIAEQLMNDTVVVLEQLVDRNRNHFELELNNIQSTDKLKREAKAKKRAERLIDDDFEFQCFHCSNFICMSSDIKKIQCHHVCVDVDVDDRVTLQRSPVPEFTENDVKMDGATYCNSCLTPLGGVFDYMGIEFPLIKIQQFRIVDRNGKGYHTKKWKGAPCKIEDVELEDLRKFAYRNNDSD